MLTQEQRTALAERLRRGREDTVAAPIPRRRAGLAELPLSFGQEQLWFLDRFAPGLPTYNSCPRCGCPARWTTAALDRALTGLVARHEAAADPAGHRGGRPPGAGHRSARPGRPRTGSTCRSWRRARGRPRCASWPTPRRRGRSTWPPGRCCGPGLVRLGRAPSTCC